MNALLLVYQIAAPRAYRLPLPRGYVIFLYLKRQKL